MKKQSESVLRRVRIEIAGHVTEAWQAKDERYSSTLGRWSDPEALLKRIHELEHPEEVKVLEGPGRQWQATWRGRFVPKRPKTQKAA